MQYFKNTSGLCNLRTESQQLGGTGRKLDRNMDLWDSYLEGWENNPGQKN